MRRRLHIKVSRSCNNNCIFCLDDRPKRTDASAGQVKELLDAHRRLGEMLFTCGEPTIHPELPLFIKMAKEAGYRSIGLVTNGRRLSYPDYCEKILSLGVNELTISIHGSSARMHDSLTRTKGSFSQTLEGLRNAAARKEAYGLRLVTSTVLSKRNMKHAAEILAFLEKLGVDTMVLNVIEPSGETLEHFDTLVPSYSEIAGRIEHALAGFPARDKVVVEGLPFCLCAGFLENTGIREEIHLLEGSELKALPPDRFHMKTGECRGCSLSPRCPGIFREYAGRRGTKELRKHVGTAPASRSPDH
jgi:MoaA/NifB/PqqE/SkfB family radical SAM enzyme